MTDRRNVDELLTEWGDPLLVEMSSSQFQRTCQEYFNLYSKKHWPEYVGQFRRPTFAMEGRHHEGGYYHPLRNLIVINTDVANDDAAFRSVLVHEMIHYYDSMVHEGRSDPKNGGHNDYFYTTMAAINRAEGHEFVRENWQREHMGRAEKPFYVYLADAGDRFAVFQSAKWDKNLIYYGLGTLLYHYASQQPQLNAYVAQTTDGRLHRFPKMSSLSSSKGKTINFYWVSRSENADLFDAVSDLATPTNRVELKAEEPVESEKEKTYYLYLATLSDQPLERAFYGYFWSPRRDPNLFPKVAEMIDYYHMKAKQPRAWVVPCTSKRLTRDLSSVNSGTKFKYGRNMAVDNAYNDEALRGYDLWKLLPLLTPANEIDLEAARAALEKKAHEFYAYVFIKDGGKNAYGFSSPKPVDALAQSVARFYQADSLHRIDDPENLLLRKLPKISTSNRARVTLGVLTSRGEDDAYYAREIKPLLTRSDSILKEGIDESAVVPVGECFSYANKLAMKLTDDPEARVVHATVQPSWHPRRYAHAWVETKDRVFDWQAAAFPRHNYHRTGWPRQLFYDEFKPKDVKKYRPEEAVALMVRHHHHGPWPDAPK